MTINAFDKRYVETYMPEFLSKIRTESAVSENAKKFGQIGRETMDRLGSSANTISMFPKTKRYSTAPTEFHVYSKAGMPKGKK